MAEAGAGAAGCGQWTASGAGQSPPVQACTPLTTLYSQHVARAMHYSLLESMDCRMHVSRHYFLVEHNRHNGLEAASRLLRSNSGKVQPIHNTLT